MTVYFHSLPDTFVSNSNVAQSNALSISLTHLVSGRALNTVNNRDELQTDSVKLAQDLS
jgi:hypothetical protein